tara:strand:+ start:3488 stop:3697 length:210 start_codon:yes stop_codon:yes gene_type:complete
MSERIDTNLRMMGMPVHLLAVGSPMKSLDKEQTQRYGKSLSPDICYAGNPLRTSAAGPLAKRLSSPIRF